MIIEKINKDDIPVFEREKLLTRLEAERQALAESEAHLRRITDHMYDMITQVDPKGIMQYITPSVKKTLEYESEDLLGKSIFDFVHPDDLNEVVCTFQLFISAAAPGKVAFRYRHAGGHYLWLDSVGTLLFDENKAVTGAVLSTRDITKRRNLENALRESEERYRQLVELSPDAIGVISQDLVVAFANKAGAKLLRAPEPVDLIGKSIEELVHPDSLEYALKQLREMFEEGKAQPLSEKKLFRLDGTILFAELTAAPLIFQDKPAALVVLRDITEHKQMEKEIARLEQLNLIGEMAAGIGHELRNPMTTVRGFLQMLGSKEECVNYKEYFNIMIEELDRANSIIKEYLSLAKDKSLDLKVQNLNKIVENMYPLIQSDAMLANNYVNIELGDLPDFLFDKKEICQLILNLTRNGIESMSPGQTMTVTTFMNGEDPVLSVKDEGEGINHDLLEKIGTPFFTTKESGTGLGLAVCYSIAARHNAVIKLETGPGGTTAFVRFRQSVT
ncbi:MAG: PAS domain-containing sensor histidine kinase [Firmicutes bacterium HGW-Firmicutes-8]|nr:MAG: PAS domain-containing sensor histidine kinase [Firmicutes bacterium HGW-Firmicutes-8]